MSIAIITEASVALGLGHVQRMLVLAGALRESSDVFFLTKSSDSVRQKIADEGYRVVHVMHGYKNALKNEEHLESVLCDYLDVEEKVAASIKECHPDARLIIFGNTSNANRYADVVVNAIIGTCFRNDRRVDPETETLYLEGPRYVMLAKAYRFHRNTWNPSNSLNKVLLMFGGSDQANLTCKATRILFEKDSALELTACVGSLYPYMDELKQLNTEMVRRDRMFNVIQNSPRVHDLMIGSDCVVTSPGNSLFEAFCLGVPALAFFQTLGQAKMFNGFPMCQDVSMLERLRELILSVVKDYGKYQEVVNSLEVGDGFQEICQTILSDE